MNVVKLPSETLMFPPSKPERASRHHTVHRRAGVRPHAHSPVKPFYRQSANGRKAESSESQSLQIIHVTDKMSTEEQQLISTAGRQKGGGQKMDRRWIKVNEVTPSCGSPRPVLGAGPWASTLHLQALFFSF